MGWGDLPARSARPEGPADGPAASRSGISQFRLVPVPGSSKSTPTVANGHLGLRSSSIPTSENGIRSRSTPSRRARAEQRHAGGAALRTRTGAIRHPRRGTVERTSDIDNIVVSAAGWHAGTSAISGRIVLANRRCGRGRTRDGKRSETVTGVVMMLMGELRVVAGRVRDRGHQEDAAAAGCHGRTALRPQLRWRRRRLHGPEEPHRSGVKIAVPLLLATSGRLSFAAPPSRLPCSSRSRDGAGGPSGT